MNEIMAAGARHYTAEDFIRPVEDAVTDMSSFRKNIALGFANAVAADAAELANEKHLDKEFVFIPEFVDALFRASASGRVDVSHDAYVSTDRLCRITVRYGREGDREEYHITLVDAVSETEYAYAGKMETSSPAGAEEEQEYGDETKRDIDEPARLTEDAGAVSGETDADSDSEEKEPDINIFVFLLGLMFAAGAVVRVFSPPSSEAGGFSQQRIEDFFNLYLSMLMIPGLGFSMVGFIQTVIGVAADDQHARSYGIRRISLGIAIVITSTLMKTIAPALIKIVTDI